MPCVRECTFFLFISTPMWQQKLLDNKGIWIAALVTMVATNL
jgi:hypothetical protein